jgi:hypothetical protein
MPEVKDKTTGKVIAEMPYTQEGVSKANEMASDNPNYMVTDGSMRSEQMYAGGGKTGYNKIGMEKPMMMGGGKMDMKYGHGGKTMKSVDTEKNPGLSKLPKEVRNKMGYMKDGGKTKVKK